MAKGAIFEQNTIVDSSDALHKQYIELKRQVARHQEKDYSQIFSLKSRFDLLRLSCIVLGIELAYSAETAFVSPILLEIGFDHSNMTMIWGIAPVLGFFLSPLIGALSDKCRLKMGRRRPFIILLSIGVILGLLLVPFTQDVVNISTAVINELNDTSPIHHIRYDIAPVPNEGARTIVKIFTVLGIILLDFSADNCLTPARTYLLDITLPEQKSRALSMFTIMAGIGGTVGYLIGGIDWSELTVGQWLGGNENTVFVIVLIVFIMSLIVTVTSFREMPLSVLEKNELLQPVSTEGFLKYKSEYIEDGLPPKSSTHSPVDINDEDEDRESPHFFVKYIKSIVCMPSPLRKLCLTNFLSLMANCCYCLYFTDFVGEVVFHGNVKAPIDSPEYQQYHEGVRFGCYGLAIYATSCTIYSMIIEKLIVKLKAKIVYAGGLLLFSVSMLMLSIYPTKLMVLLLSASGGVIYSTIFTIPFLLVSTYHAKLFKQRDSNGNSSQPSSRYNRGLATDIAIVWSMLFVAQFIISLTIGQFIELLQSSIAVIYGASIFAFLSALSALNVVYLDV